MATTGGKDKERAGMRVISGQQSKKAPPIAAGPQGSGAVSTSGAARDILQSPDRGRKRYRRHGRL
jgi:hypothetical protein